MIEFDTLYKNVSETPPLFITGNVKKKSFSQKITFLMYFAVASLLGHKFGLASELRKVLLITTIEGLDRRPLISSRNL